MANQRSADTGGQTGKTITVHPSQQASNMTAKGLCHPRVDSKDSGSGDSNIPHAGLDGVEFRGLVRDKYKKQKDWHDEDS